MQHIDEISAPISIESMREKVAALTDFRDDTPEGRFALDALSALGFIWFRYFQKATLTRAFLRVMLIDLFDPHPDNAQQSRLDDFFPPNNGDEINTFVLLSLRRLRAMPPMQYWAVSDYMKRAVRMTI